MNLCLMHSYVTRLNYKAISSFIHDYLGVSKRSSLDGNELDPKYR